MKNSVLTPEEKKARKSAYDKKYRSLEKSGIVARPTVEDAPEAKVAKPKKEDAVKKEAAVKPEKVEATFERTFDFPVRLYWNMRMDRKSSSCAKAGTPLNFEEIIEKDEVVAYRVRRGKRNFFTTPMELSVKG